MDTTAPASSGTPSSSSSSTSTVDFSKPLLFECAWEVANKVGGIYTVIKTKCPVTCQEYGDRYCLLGPLNYKTAHMEVEALDKAHYPALDETIRALRKAGIGILFGKWLVEGAPHVLLFDVGSARHRMDEWKSDLWNIAGIPAPPNDFETNDAVVFGYLVTWFLGEFQHQCRKYMNQQQQLSEASSTLTSPISPNPTQHQQQQPKRKRKPLRIIAHFHEWLVGVALILIRKRNLDIATIFTTHATLLGRYLCAGDVDFYNNLKSFDVDAEAGKRGIYHRYCIERAATHCADVFTTVSHITAYESEWLLKRKPDGVLPNGLNVVKFSAMHEFQNLHARNKEKIHDFMRGHFYGHLDFDLDNTVYFFTAGRYEYRNKGVDMFIESLARLNARLKSMGSSLSVVAFIIMPAATHSFTVEALKGQAVMKQLKETVNEIQSEIGRAIFESAARGQVPDPNTLLKEEKLILLKRRVFALKRDSLPPIVTHNMADDAFDPILNQLRRTRLFNAPQDRVKVIFHPEFLNSNNPLLGMDYDDFVRGTHLGVFPSYYEPWGYTPAECTVMGIPSITTNLSGFGCFMEEMIENPKDYGIYIVDRRLKSVEESVEQLADHMLDFCLKSRRQRINQRNRTERLSDLLDWKRMGLEYVKARWVAIHRKWPTIVDDDDEEEESGDFLSDSSFYGAQDGNEEDYFGYYGEDPLFYPLHQNKVPRPPSAPGSPKLRESFVDEDEETGAGGGDVHLPSTTVTSEPSLSVSVKTDLTSKPDQHHEEHPSPISPQPIQRTPQRAPSFVATDEETEKAIKPTPIFPGHHHPQLQQPHPQTSMTGPNLSVPTWSVVPASPSQSDVFVSGPPAGLNQDGSRATNSSSSVGNIITAATSSKLSSKDQFVPLALNEPLTSPPSSQSPEKLEASPNTPTVGTRRKSEVENVTEKLKGMGLKKK